MENNGLAVLLIFLLVGLAVYFMKRFEQKKLIADSDNVKTSSKSTIVFVLQILGFISIVAAIFLFAIDIQISLTSGISGIILIAIAELVHNSQKQTELLGKILDKENE